MSDPCNDLREKLAEYLEPHEIDELCRQVDQHLKACSDCRLEVDSVRKTITIVRAHGEVHAPVWLSDRLSTMLAREYEGGGGTD